MKNKTIIIILLFLVGTMGVQAQDKDIILSGVIVCEDSIRGPLNFVNVYNKNTKRGTVSNVKGEFSISIGKNDTILFSTVQHKEVLYYIKENEFYHDKSIEISMKGDIICLDVFSVMGFKEFEEFKQEILRLRLPNNDISLALPVIDKYAKQNVTGEGAFDLRAPLIYLSKKISMIAKRKSKQD